ncbi:hypothetical protein [Demequina sp.]|uniref:hypothetical protein n=1 Tax=Demequina sp. TaxID=2050685 RepID=UPI0025C6386A|nr:hypothetical protein [Demequina sp.]
MSAAPLRSNARPGAVPAAAPPRAPHLRAVTAPQHARSIAPFAWLCVGIVVAALSAVLVLNTTMSEGSYTTRALKIEIAQLHQERAAALIQLEANAAPEALARRAAELGMQPAGRTGFVTLESGKVLEAGGQ